METLRLDQTAREQLIQLKRRTGIKTWNVLCRWGLARSLRDPNTPPAGRPAGGAAVEIDWHTFAGANSVTILAATTAWLIAAGEAPNSANIDSTITSHVHRGIAHLAGSRDLSAIEELIG